MTADALKRPTKIHVRGIDETGRLRPVDKAHAELIAASIEQRGLLQPILVRERAAPILEGQPPYLLVLGAHRLEAVKMLGWPDLEVGKQVIIIGADDFDARIMEIDENIARHNLNALDRAIFLYQRKMLYLERNEVLGRGGDRRSKKIRELFNSESLRIDFSERFSEDAAKRTGYSESTIQKAIWIAEHIDKAAAESIRGTMVEDNQNELRLLCKLKPGEQREAAKRIRSGEVKTIVEARVVIGLDKPKADDPPRARYTKLLAAWDATERDHLERNQFMEDAGLVALARNGCLSKCWEKADAEERERFMDEVGLGYVKGAKA